MGQKENCSGKTLDNNYLHIIASPMDKDAMGNKQNITYVSSFWKKGEFFWCAVALQNCLLLHNNHKMARENKSNRIVCTVLYM